jgi:hypothetical protein
MARPTSSHCVALLTLGIIGMAGTTGTAAPLASVVALVRQSFFTHSFHTDGAAILDTFKRRREPQAAADQSSAASAPAAEEAASPSTGAAPPPRVEAAGGAATASGGGQARDVNSAAAVSAPPACDPRVSEVLNGACVPTCARQFVRDVDTGGCVSRPPDVVQSRAQPERERPTCQPAERAVGGECQCMPNFTRSVATGACHCDARIREMVRGSCVLQCGRLSVRSAATGHCEPDPSARALTDIVAELTISAGGRKAPSP